MNMPSSRNYRKASMEEKSSTKKGKSVYRASSFHGIDSSSVAEMMRRPRTVPNLFSTTAAASSAVPEAREVNETGPRKLPKLLLNVTLQRSLGPVHVLMSPDSSVGDLIAAAVRIYVKEGHRPILASSHPDAFDLHYSQFSLESLSKEDKLMTLGSRNFFLCPKKIQPTESNGRCSNEVGNSTNIGLPWLKFMDLLL